MGRINPSGVFSCNRATIWASTSCGQGKPKLGSLQVNPRIPADVVEELKRRQHEVTVNGATNAWPAMIVIDPGTKRAFGSGSASGTVQ
jgi:hypothetical protein